MESPLVEPASDAFPLHYRVYPRRQGDTPAVWSNRPLPPNTLRNADGSPYAAGHDSAIDEQKMKAHHYARAFTQKLSRDLFCGNEIRSSVEWSLDDISAFEHFLREHLEEFALTILKETSSQ